MQEAIFDEAMPQDNVAIVTLESLVRNLNEARADFESQKTYVKQLEDNFRDANSDAYQSLTDLRNMVDCLEIDVKRFALDRYAETKDKKVTAGVNIKVFTKLSYPAEKALDWAREHKLCLIPESLDVKAFDGICKSDNSRPEFVTTYEKHQAQIDKDLSKSLGA